MRYRSTFDDLFDVFRDFDDLFRRTFQDFGEESAVPSRLLPAGHGKALAPPAGAAGRGWFPATESFVKDQNFHLRMELPGVKPEDVSISVTGDLLQVSGEKKTNREVDEKSLYFSESRYGRFERSFRLPEGVRSEDVKARFENGVLELTLPVPEEVKARTIKIEVGGDPKKIKAA
ncbi:MAG TPA: Hsp20/alpha crystallin family protein [Candidatus Saccharimonadales bacterium]|nr:Hsp20/alpha crystallin family protein [Candidatus Saccharimonadales bacterium]